ncbi:MAG: HAD superfamily hydrolase [Candidatus Methanohalarchaeum thermophilum]|uniref:phosphoserine phosphatase n=1 Tax=Methanohalarchaeum thermophilum TaxID=1903181 RepID=A0A1Q6DTH6_METT1|nr:MAG: HAD superfamily hydrolase [Candidatus Methanohalarchaeum thermophilum]
MEKIVCFDLEGPLSPQDNAFELMESLENGKDVFKKISKYDDIISMEGREDYEPGDTLSLIVPFLLVEDIDEELIRDVSAEAKIIDGVKELVDELKADDWRTFIISTSYEQHAHSVGERIGIGSENIRCTKLSFEELRPLVKDIQGDLKDIFSEIRGLEDEELIDALDDFFFDFLPQTDYGNPLERVKVIGGSKKVEAAVDFSKRENVDLSDLIVVGDSITDYKMLKEIREEGGTSIVFNGNEYAVPEAEFAVASSDIRVIKPLLVGDAEEIAKSVNGKLIPSNINLSDYFSPEFIEELSEMKYKPYIHYLDDKDEKELKEVIDIHEDFRQRVRGEAGELG